jgi:hypothetical protein
MGGGHGVMERREDGKRPGVRERLKTRAGVKENCGGELGSGRLGGRTGVGGGRRGRGGGQLVR